jgi:hypothetical protein
LVWYDGVEDGILGSLEVEGIDEAVAFEFGIF